MNLPCSRVGQVTTAANDWMKRRVATSPQFVQFVHKQVGFHEYNHADIRPTEDEMIGTIGVSCAPHGLQVAANDALLFRQACGRGRRGPHSHGSPAPFSAADQCGFFRPGAGQSIRNG